MASMRDIKRRKASIQSTGQITRAMKLVSTVKLQKAKTRAEEARPYFEGMFETVQSILSRTPGLEHPYAGSSTGTRKAVIVITSNRGLAGGYNANIVKLITRGESGLAAEEKENLDIYAIGKKGRDAFVRYGYTVKEEYAGLAEEADYEAVREITQKVLDAYEKGEIGEIYLAFTRFQNTVVHEPELKRLLPLDRTVVSEAAKDTASQDSPQLSVPMNFEAEEEEILKLLVPQYMTSLIYGALLESAASENGARMQAMDSATNNAEEMIDSLTLLYNRARQGSITQELTEIIAGANAIS